MKRSMPLAPSPAMRDSSWEKACATVGETRPRPSPARAMAMTSAPTVSDSFRGAMG